MMQSWITDISAFSPTRVVVVIIIIIIIIIIYFLNFKIIDGLFDLI